MSGSMLSSISRSVQASSAFKPRYTRAISPIRCHSRDTSQTSLLWTALIGSTAAALVWTIPVEAGVILPQPTLKKIVPEATTASQKSKPNVSRDAPVVQINIDIGSISLPLTLVGCVALYFIAQRLDTGFDSFMDQAWLKDSATNGVGYEPADKSADYVRGSKR